MHILFSFLSPSRSYTINYKRAWGGGGDDRGHIFFPRISGIISYLLEPGGIVPATGESGYLSTLQPKVTNTKRKEKGKHVGKS